MTPSEFRDAISYLTGTEILFGSGPLFIDVNNRKVLDEGDNNTDITPNEATLNQALIDMQTASNANDAQDTTDETAFNDFQSIVNTALQQIASDEAALENASTFADLKPLLANMMVRDKKTIKALSGIIRRMQV